MTTLTITPNWKNKTARFKGTIAAGEHVAVSIANDDSFIGDTTNLRLRVVNLANGKTLAQFPMPDADGEDGEEEVLPSSETPAEGEVDWASDLTPLYCILNLNTDRMLMAVPPGANVQLLFVLDDYDGKTLYFKDMCEVTHWPRRVGEEEPTNLDDYKDLIEDFRERIDAAETTVAAAAASIASAVDEASGIVSRAEMAEEVAGSFKNQAVSAKNAAVDAKDAALVAQGLAETAQGKAEDAQTAAETAQTAAETAQGKAEDAQEAAEDAAEAARDAAETAVATEKARAEGAEEILDDAIEAEETRATEAETALANNLAGAFKAVSYDSTNKKIVFTKQNGTTDSIDASAFIKDGMVSSVAISNSNLVISFNTDAGQSPISIPLTNIFNPANYYDKTTANNTFVAKEQGKGLTSNDFTTAYKDKLDGIEVGAEKNVGVEYTQTEKAKLSGVEASAKDNVVEAANFAAFPATGVAGKIYVAKDENKTYRWDGSQYAQVGGSFIDIVSPSTNPADAGKAADAKATGDALAMKRGVTDLDVRGAPTPDNGGQFVVNGVAVQYDAIYGVWNATNATIEYHYGSYSVGGPWGSADFTISAANGYRAVVDSGSETFGTFEIVGILDSLATTGQTASTADVALTPVLGDWVCSPTTYDGKTLVIEQNPMRPGYWQPKYVEDGLYAGTERGDGDTSAMRLEWAVGWDGAENGDVLVATRRLLGYTLGAQTTKPLAALDNPNFAPIYSASATYAVGALCVLGGMLYRCTSAISTAEAWNSAHWAATTVADALAAKQDTISDLATIRSGAALGATAVQPSALTSKVDSAALAPAYSASSAYSVGDVVTYNGRRYKCSTAIVSGGETWTAAHWTEESVQTALDNATPGLDNTKLNSTSAAPAFSASATYAVGEYCTYNGVLYECVVTKTTASAATPDEDIYDSSSAPTNHWTAKDMTTPDATLDILPDGTLKVSSTSGTLWRQGYDLASESAATLPGNHVNYYAFAATTAAAFSDATAYAIGDRVAYDGKVYKFTAAHSAGAWDSSVVAEDPDTQAMALPTVAAGKVGDFGLDVDNSANTVETVASLTGLDNAFSVVVPKGQSLVDMLTFAGGELATLYFTLTAFKVNNLPTWQVLKQVVENGGAQS